MPTAMFRMEKEEGSFVRAEVSFPSELSLRCLKLWDTSLSYSDGDEQKGLVNGQDAELQARCREVAH